MKRVCLGMPGYGEMTAGAGRGLWRSSKGVNATIPLAVDVRYHEGSLLACNFNALWCWALNLAHKGEKVDYFAMLHADVEPEDGWLDVLVEELEERGLDVLSCVIPIKEPKGRTSTALARPDGDTWRAQCRLTMQEAHRLPETFTEEDTGYPLLLNTGCWVCRFDESWAKKVHFEINDRIAFSTASDSYVMQVEPEDWHFSRLCNELGLKIGATRKVQLQHVGKARFPNHVPWGDQFDGEYVPESLLPVEDTSGFRFPYDVDGWLLYEEGKALWELAKDKRVLEIGSYCGKSTICIGQSAEVVHAVDPHDGRATPKPKGTMQEMQENLTRYGVDRWVHIIQGTLATNSRTSFELSYCGPFDLIFIDGDHSEESVQSDVDAALPLLAPGGLLAFHDYRSQTGEFDGRWDPGVTTVVDRLLRNGARLESRHKTLAVVRPVQTESLVEV